MKTRPRLTLVFCESALTPAQDSVDAAVGPDQDVKISRLNAAAPLPCLSIHIAQRYDIIKGFDRFNSKLRFYLCDQECKR